MHACRMRAAGHPHDGFLAVVAGCAAFSSRSGWLPLLRGAEKPRLAAAETCGSGWKYAAMPLACPGSALPGPAQQCTCDVADQHSNPIAVQITCCTAGIVAVMTARRQGCVMLSSPAAVTLGAPLAACALPGAAHSRSGCRGTGAGCSVKGCLVIGSRSPAVHIATLGPKHHVLSCADNGLRKERASAHADNDAERIWAAGANLSGYRLRSRRQPRRAGGAPGRAGQPPPCWAAPPAPPRSLPGRLARHACDFDRLRWADTHPAYFSSLIMPQEHHFACRPKGDQRCTCRWLSTFSQERTVTDQAMSRG